MIEDTTIFADVADALNIAEVAFVEKDYYATQLIKLINEIESPDYKLIFSGGTCLSKAYQNTKRMSEDIDIKFTGRRPDLKRKNRKLLSKLVSDVIEKSDIFNIDTPPIYLDVYRTQTFDILYPKSFKHSALKPNLKLELVESVIYEPTYHFPIRSMYSEAMRFQPELDSMECVNMESIVIEKLIALLWRISAYSLGTLSEKDTALIRHVYDIHVLMSSKQKDIDPEILTKISVSSLENHAARYQTKHPAFLSNPREALLHGMKELQLNQEHRKQYEKLLSPLVYAQSPPSWQQAFASIQQLYHDLYTD